MPSLSLLFCGRRLHQRKLERLSVYRLIAGAEKSLRFISNSPLALATKKKGVKQRIDFYLINLTD